MKAICLREPSGGLHLEDRTRRSPADGELLIRVHACGVCHGDLMVRKGAFPFVKYPVVPGHEIAGEVKEMDWGADLPVRSGQLAGSERSTVKQRTTAEKRVEETCENRKT
jgi:D-arabinose 1-dehydrogenase-like Zn-dependent alcohol dehydrogenase